MFHVTWPHLFEKRFANRGLALATATMNLSTKFDVSISTDYKDMIMKDKTKYGKWGGLGQLGVTLGHWK